MRLLKLELLNFGSFGHAAIDLEEIDSATISGRNGHGKSTGFVDAPLWALFGKCRTDTDSMMRMNEERMSVDLTFSIDHERYRVFRSRSKATKGGKTELSFAVADIDRTWLPIGGHSIKETQEAIRNVLNADYELFVCTSFLVQGKADRFTAATPTERKAILAQILRLDQYATMKTLANRQATRIEPVLELLYKEREPLKRKTESLLTTKKEILTVQEGIEKLSAELQIAEKRVRDHEEERTKSQTRIETFQPIAVLLETALQKEHTFKTELNTIDFKMGNADGLLKRKEEILWNLETLQKRKDELQTLDLDITRNFSADRELRTMSQKAHEQRQVAATKIQETTLKLGQLGAQALTVKVNHQRHLEELQAQLIREEKEVELLGQVPCGKDLQDICKFTVGAVVKQEAMPRLKELIRDTEKLDPVAVNLPSYVDDEKQLQEEIAKLSTKELDFQITEIQHRINSLYKSEQEMQRKKKVIASEIGQLQKYVKLETDLKVAEEERKNLELLRKSTARQVEELNADIVVKREALLEKKKLEEWLEHSNKHLPTLKLEYETIKRKLESSNSVLADFRRLIGECEAAQVRLDQLAVEDKETQITLQAAQLLSSIYASIPVMLMEQAVPMLEVACNSILEQISPTGMRIRLETQKALKSSDRVSETLDILVRDVFGERPYENYSGGERFRLDLALRFGLSQLLMNRAGSRIESLIIDEGLGTLDAEGLQLLRECLSKMETNFGLILVISHVEAIQGTFPASITVVKDATGSQFEVET